MDAIDAKLRPDLDVAIGGDLSEVAVDLARRLMRLFVADVDSDV